MNETFLLSDMRGAVSAVRSFDPRLVLERLGPIGRNRRILVCGEGSSRILPGKRARALDAARRRSLGVSAYGCLQSAAFDLSGSDVIALSNSGRTAELISLLDALKALPRRDGRIVGASAFDEPLFRDRVDAFLPLSCGPEKAVAATKSVIEQALLVETLCADAAGETLPSAGDLSALAAAVDSLVCRQTEPALRSALACAGTVYVSGADDGAAEELALKAVEILGKRAVYLEGTLLLHGIEESMQEGDALILVMPDRSTLGGIDVRLRKGAKVSVTAISDYDTGFPTAAIPSIGRFTAFAALAAGWRLLHDSGVASGRDVDHPKRARKIGNEFGLSA